MFGLIIGIIQIINDYKKENTRIDRDLRQTINIVNKSLKHTVFELNNDLANEVATGLLAYRSILSIIIYDDIGNIMVRKDRKPISVRDWWVPSFIFPDKKNYSFPIEVENIVSNKARIELTVDALYSTEEFISRSFFILIAGVLRNVLLAFALLVLSYYVISKPLSHFINFLLSIDPVQPEKSKLKISANKEDELGIMAKIVNSLLLKIKDKTEIVQNLNKDLENKVVELESKGKNLLEHSERLEMVLANTKSGAWDWDVATGK